MATPPQFLVTNESINVVYEGKSYVVKKGSPHFVGLKKALSEEDWDAVPGHLTVAKSVETWSNDKFTVKNYEVLYLGEKVPQGINDRILSMATNGEDPTPLYNFWERLSKNPSFRSVNQLYDFLKHKNIPLTPDGCFLAYKGVKNDYKDAHSGKFSNKPGTILEMPRNKISDDPNFACHEGFHVGAIRYANSFSERVVVCKVDPENVVCVPFDSSQEKMRVCKYEVIGNYGADLPSTSYDDNKIEPDDEAEEMEVDNELDENDMEKAPPPEDEVEEKVPAKKPSKKPTKKTKVDTSKVKKAVPAKFNKYQKMGMNELIKQSLDDLRKYATYGMEIVGASKIPGGKTALIATILKVRG